MTWAVLIQSAQVVSALAWIGVSHHYAGSVWRIVARRTLGSDWAGFWACLMGVVQTGFTARWLVVGGNATAGMSEGSLRFWLMLYLANAAVAVGILHTWRDWETPSTSRSTADRSRAALALWFVIFMATAGLVWSVG